MKKLQKDHEWLKKQIENYKSWHDLLVNSYDTLSKSQIDIKQQSFIIDDPTISISSLKMLNEMLIMKSNTYKIQIDSLNSEVNSLNKFWKKTLEDQENLKNFSEKNRKLMFKVRDVENSRDYMYIARDKELQQEILDLNERIELLMQAKQYLKEKIYQSIEALKSSTDAYDPLRNKYDMGATQYRILQSEVDRLIKEIMKLETEKSASSLIDLVRLKDKYNDQESVMNQQIKL